MLIGNKIFPYPLLRDKENNTDYKSTQFFFDFDKENDSPIILNGKLVLKNIYFSLDNPELKELYENGYLKAICEVECSSTEYREFFELFETGQDREIPITHFSNIVTISAFLVATKEIENFESEDFELKSSPDGDYAKVDFDNAIVLYKHLKDLPKHVLGDERFWMWIILEKGYAAAVQAMPMESGKNVIKDHWMFGQGRRRGLMFGALSRVFYKVCLTKDDTLDDPYLLTKFATDKYLRYREFSWRGYSNNKTIVIGALKAEMIAIEKYGAKIESIKDYYPEIAKFISKLGSVMLLDFMTEEYITNEVVGFCDSLAKLNNISE